MVGNVIGVENVTRQELFETNSELEKLEKLEKWTRDTKTKGVSLSRNQSRSSTEIHRTRVTMNEKKKYIGRE